MLKMVLADDESIVRDGLCNIIDWRQCGIEIVAVAADGQAAIDLCLEHHPDILFTDIRMPFFDGLEVAAYLKERGEALKVILFSGVQDFSYAKSALNINAEGYILKPLEIAELVAVVTKVVQKITNEKRLAAKVQNLKDQLNENFGAAREKFLRNLILGTYKNETEIGDKLVYFKEPVLAQASVAVAVLQLDDYAKTIENYHEADKQLLSFSVTSVVEEVLRRHCRGACALMGDNEYVILFNPQPEEQPFESDLYTEIAQSLQTYLQLSVSIGIGRTVANLQKINSAYKEALNALHFKFYTGKGSIINISDIRPEAAAVVYPDFYEAENQLANLVKAGNVGATQAAVEKLFAEFKLEQRYTVEYVQRICAELVFTLSKALYEIGEDRIGIAGRRPAILDTIDRAESIFELQQQIDTLLATIASHFATKYTQKNSKIITEIKRLIDREYMEDLSVNKIADTVYLSPNYLSLIFKRETGETLTDYLTKKRIEIAKDLLRTTDARILDVAAMVGFQDASYFSKVFKKQTGVHPQKYRTPG